MAVEACVIDPEGRIALLEATPEIGWRLPRTAVRKGEALDEALRRLLLTDFRIHVAACPEFFWMYPEGLPESGAMSGVYVVRQWRQDLGATALKLSFFSLTALPPGIPSQDVARIRQAVEGRAPFEVC